MFHAAHDLFEEITYTRSRRLNRRDTHQFLCLYRQLAVATPHPPHTAYRDARCRFPRTWFKDGAGSHLILAWQLCILLNRAGSRVRPVRAHDPGLILWEDDVQAVIRTRHRIASRPLRAPRDRSVRWNGDRTTIRRWPSPAPPA